MKEKKLLWGQNISMLGNEVKAKETNVNRNYKDTIFRMLYRDKENLLSLFNAIQGTHYKDSSQLQINTLENALYLGMRNDVSCVIDMRMSLYENQSTVNPNIPLRDLFYVSTLYQGMISEKQLYGRKKMMLPRPKFIVFYNGVEEQPEQRFL